MQLQETTFKAALPYGLYSLAEGSIGTFILFNEVSVIWKIISIFVVTINLLRLFITLTCGIIYAKDSEKFKEKVIKYYIPVPKHDPNEDGSFIDIFKDFNVNNFI
jgi:hypothetical protein